MIKRKIQFDCAPQNLEKTYMEVKLCVLNLCFWNLVQPRSYKPLCWNSCFTWLACHESFWLCLNWTCYRSIWRRAFILPACIEEGLLRLEAIQFLLLVKELHLQRLCSLTLPWIQVLSILSKILSLNTSISSIISISRLACGTEMTSYPVLT